MKNAKKPSSKSEVRELSHGRIWYRTTEDGIYVGVTDLGLEKTGAVESIEFPTDAESFSSREAVATIEGTLGKLIIPAPCDCTVIESNSALMDDHDLLQEDPLDGGWVVRLLPEDEVEESEEVADEDEEESEEDDDDGDEEI